MQNDVHLANERYTFVLLRPWGLTVLGKVQESSLDAQDC